MFADRDNRIGLIAAVVVVACIVGLSWWNDGRSVERGPFGLPVSQSLEAR